MQRPTSFVKPRPRCLEPSTKVVLIGSLDRRAQRGELALHAPERRVECRGVLDRDGRPHFRGAAGETRDVTTTGSKKRSMHTRPRERQRKSRGHHVRQMTRPRELEIVLL